MLRIVIVCEPTDLPGVEIGTGRIADELLGVRRALLHAAIRRSGVQA